MELFNWDTARGTVSKKWLKINHKLPLTEEEYIKGMKGLGRTGKQYSPSKLKHNYHYLKEQFGFFENETYPKD